jgi:hypothetical protein
MIKTGLIINSQEAYLSITLDGNYLFIGLRTIHNTYLQPYNFLYLYEGVLSNCGAIGSEVDAFNGALIIKGVDII